MHKAWSDANIDELSFTKVKSRDLTYTIPPIQSINHPVNSHLVVMHIEPYILYFCQCLNGYNESEKM